MRTFPLSLQPELLFSQAHDVHLCGRILIFIAKIYPFFDKSGLNTNWFINSGLALPMDVLQPDCLDTEGNVIDIPLYNTFWGLQNTFQVRFRQRTQGPHSQLIHGL